MNENWVNDWYLIGAASEVTPGSVGQRTIGGTPLAVFNLEGNVFAVEDRCHHCDAALSAGVLRQRSLECSHCGHSFPVVEPTDDEPDETDVLKTYPLMVVDGEIFAWIEDGA